MQKTFRALPLFDLVSIRQDAIVTAESDFAALLAAKAVLGDSTPFDLLAEGRLVVSYRPTAPFGPVRAALAKPDDVESDRPLIPT